MEDNSLNIIVSLQDEASTELSSMVETMTSTLSDMADTFATVSSESESSIGSMQSGVATQLNDMASDLNSLIADFDKLPEAIQNSVMEAGGSFDTMATAIEDATATSSEAMDAFAMDVVKNIGLINATMDAMADNTATQTGKMNAGLLAIGALAAGTFSKISGIVSDSTAAADQWNQESAAVAQTLKDTGSSIPLSQVQAYAVQMQQNTAFTQQQALAAADVILKYKDLQGSYQGILSSAADAAVAQGEASGTLGNLGAAAKLVGDAMENPIQGLSRLQQIGIVLTPQQAALAKTLATGTTITTKNAEAVALTAAQTSALTDKITKEKSELAILNEEHTKSVAVLTTKGNTVANLSDKQNAAAVANDKHALAVKNLTEEIQKNQATLAAGTTGKTKEVSTKTSTGPDVAGADALVKGALGNISGLAEQSYAAADGIDHLKQEMNGASTSLGESFIPLTNKLNELLKPIVSGLQAFTSKFPGLSAGIILVVGGLVGLLAFFAILGFTLPLLSTGFAALGITMAVAFSPITLIIIAVAVLIAIVAEIIIHWSQVSAFFIKMWDDIKKLWTEGVAYVKQAWDNLWNGARQLVNSIWGTIKDDVQEGWDWLEQIFDKAGAVLTSAWKALWSGLGSVVTDIWEGVKAIIKDAINSIISLINDVINSINSVMSKAAGVLHLSAPQIPDIPLLANGGIVNQATLAIIGEAGPEAVIPLSQMGNLSGGGQGTQGQNVVININNPSVRNNQDIDELRKMVDRALRPLLVNTKIAHI